MLREFERYGDLRSAKRVMTILAISAGQVLDNIAQILKVDPLTVYRWLQKFLLGGPESLKSMKSPGRKPALTKSQKRELDKMITDGPSECGFPGACWRSPMIQKLIYEKFGVFYSVHYISQLLKNMGFSYQKAKFVSDHHDPVER